MSLFIVGVSGGSNIGGTFFKIAQRSNLNPVFFNSKLAYQAPKLVHYMNRYLRGKQPACLDSFSQDLLEVCSQQNPQWLLTTGIAPVNASSLKSIGRLGVKRINFLTDDPWNVVHRAAWFHDALSQYDVIFSPRRANIDDLKQTGCRHVEYLPFGYEPDLFHPEPVPMLGGEQSDVVFAGGGDRDRVPYMDALVKAGIKLDLYGSYWERFPETKPLTHGQADLATLRVAIQRAKVALCLVRRANRDGHCMRTFEVPAVGTCMLTEDTSEHREIFGAEGQAVLYFSTLPEMVEKTQWLLNHDLERMRLAENAYRLITQGKHTYADRLNSILSSTMATSY
jgi:spore maturation protein CgeB